MIPHSAALVEGVAQALTWAINDPLGHSAWNTSVCHNLSLITSADLKSKRLRGERETMRAATVFDSSVVPPIGIDKYLMRLRQTFRCSDASFIAAFILVDRVLGYDGGRLPLSMRNVHRLFLASLVVAVKYHEDLVYTNSHYAKAGGVHLREVNRLERVILAALDFDLRVAPEQYHIYEASLASLCSSATSASAPLLGTAGCVSSFACKRPSAAAVLKLVPTHNASASVGTCSGASLASLQAARSDHSLASTLSEKVGAVAQARGEVSAAPGNVGAEGGDAAGADLAETTATVEVDTAGVDSASHATTQGVSGGRGTVAPAPAGHSANRRRRRR